MATAYEQPASIPGLDGAAADGDPVEQSVAYFRDGLYCSEAILRAFNESHRLGLDPSAYTIATPFGAGMGAAKCSCGAVTGGLLVLGLARGRTGTDQSEEPAFTVAKELHDRFRARYKVICCRGLTRRLPWGEPEHHQACQEYVRFAAAAVRDLLSDGPAWRDSTGAAGPGTDSDDAGLPDCLVCPVTQAPSGGREPAEAPARTDHDHGRVAVTTSDGMPPAR